MNGKCLLTLFVLAAVALPVSGQEPDGRLQRLVALADPRARLAIAIASEAYPVTPGDIYNLSYASAGQAVSFDVVVRSDYTIGLRLFGQVAGRGKTFLQIRQEVEGVVARAYPNSLPALEIRSVGLFPILVKGAVPSPGRIVAWGLSRLSDVFQEGLEPYGSDRAVLVISAGEVSREYDLFRATHMGEEDHDPLLKAADVVIVPRSDRTVELQGEINRAGRYRLQESEGTSELLFQFGAGPTPLADLGRIRLERWAGEEMSVSYLSLEELRSRPLHDGDVITLPPKTANRPIAFFEGAVQTATAGERASSIIATVNAGEEYGRVMVPFTPGETVFGAFQTIQNALAPLADLGGAFLIRRDEAQPIPLDLQRLMGEYSVDRDPALWPYDRIVIPTSRAYVTVSGAVTAPGAYNYSAGKPPSFYLTLAGGIDPERNVDGSVLSLGPDGTRMTGEAVVKPGSRLIVPANSFAYNFNRYFPIIATSLAFATTVITVIDLLAR